MGVRVPDSGSSGSDTFTANGPTNSGSLGSGGVGSGSSSGPVVMPVPGGAATAGISEGVYQVSRGTPDRVEHGTGVAVDPRAVVSVAPQTASGGANAGDVFIALGPGDGAKSGNRIRLANGANPITVRVRNLNDIGVYGTNVGDGIAITVLSGS